MAVFMGGGRRKKRAFKVKLRTREMGKIESRFIDLKILNIKNTKLSLYAA